MTHIFQTGSPGFNYTLNQHQNLLGTVNKEYYQEAIEKKVYSCLVFPPSTEAAGVNRLQQFVVLIKQLPFLENLTGYIKGAVC